MTENQKDFLQKVSKAHRDFNNLLTTAYRYKLECNLEINNYRAIKDDDRKVIGLTVTEVNEVYNNDGVA